MGWRASGVGGSGRAGGGGRLGECLRDHSLDSDNIE